MKRPKKRTKRLARKIVTIRTVPPAPTWRLLNAGVPIIDPLVDRINRMLVVMPMIQSQRETLIEARDVIAKAQKKVKRK